MMSSDPRVNGASKSVSPSFANLAISVMQMLREQWRKVAGLTLLLGVLYYLRAKLKKSHSPIGQIPPSKYSEVWPLGHLVYLGPNLLEGLRKLCVESADKETGLAQFYLTSQFVVSVLRAEDVQKVLNSSNFRADIFPGTLHLTRFLGHKSIILLSDSQWKIHRRLLRSSFYNESFQNSMTTDICKVASDLVQKLQEVCGESVVEMDVLTMNKKVTLDVIGKTAFNYEFNNVSRSEPSKLASTFQFLHGELSRRMLEEPLNPLVYSYSLPTPANRKFHAGQRLVRATLRSMIHQKRAELAKGEAQCHEDLLKYIVQTFDKEFQDNADDEIVDEIVTFLFGGFDTTSIALTYALYEIAKRPEVEAQILQEVAAVLEGRDQVSYEEYGRLRYTQAVLRETLRMYPPVPLTMRSIDKAVELDNGIVLEPGTAVWIPIWWIHRSEHNWDNPGSFDPSRFLNVESYEHTDDGSGSANSRQNPYSWVPFSGGPRNCLGQKFSLMEGTIVLALLLRSIKFSNAPEHIEITSHGLVQNPADKQLLLSASVRAE